jgi:hypothetical protein
LRAAIGIPIVGRFSDDSVGFGIDPETIVTIAVANEPAIDVLEDVLAQCSEAIECTWQIRRGYVEVGTKARLSIPAARETRIYEIRDLMIEAPNFDSGESFRVRELREAIGASPEPGRSSTGRSQPLALAVKIVEEIVETIEPEHWDFGQPIEPTEDERVDRDNAIAQPEPAESEGDSPDAEPTSQPSSQPEQIPRAQAGVIVWASIRLWRDQLIVVAPDFIHRQIGGYPELKRESVMVDSDDLPSSSEVPHD